MLDGSPLFCTAGARLSLALGGDWRAWHAAKAPKTFLQDGQRYFPGVNSNQLSGESPTSGFYSFFKPEPGNPFLFNLVWHSFSLFF